MVLDAVDGVLVLLAGDPLPVRGHRVPARRDEELGRVFYLLAAGVASPVVGEGDRGSFWRLTVLGFLRPLPDVGGARRSRCHWWRVGLRSR